MLHRRQGRGGTRPRSLPSRMHLRCRNVSGEAINRGGNRAERCTHGEQKSGSSGRMTISRDPGTNGIADGMPPIRYAGGQWTQSAWRRDWKRGRRTSTTAGSMAAGSGRIGRELGSEVDRMGRCGWAHATRQKEVKPGRRELSRTGSKLEEQGGPAALLRVRHFWHHRHLLPGLHRKGRP